MYIGSFLDIIGYTVSEHMIVAVLENNYKAPGIYEYTFNADKLKSGIYICKLEAGTISSAIKMVLMK
jgi:hypothetical protein